MGAIGILFALAIVMIGGSVAGNSTGHLGSVPTAILMVAGIALAIVSGVLLIVTRLYQKTKASEAFVRTGQGGKKVIKDGGALFIPVFHELIRISLETLRLQVSRTGPDALITKDNLRADVMAEFYVKVPAEDDAILNAARAFGEKMIQPNYVKSVVEDKLVTALRNVATKMTLQELNSNRDDLLKQVTDIVKLELLPNGLTLETVTISKLDQTDQKQLRADNIFDAQGMATIAKIVQERLTERNKLEREGEQARTKQDVETRKQVLELERSRAEAEATQQGQIQQAQAEQSRIAQEKQIEAQRQVELAGVEKQKQIEVAQRSQQQAVEVAERQKLAAIKKAEQLVEVAEREKQAAVAQAEQKRAVAEADQATAEAKRETERQSITTVQVTAEAERKQKQQVIAATAEAEQKYIEAAKAADGEAYALKAKAEGQKAAAEADAAAITQRANAEASAKEAQAKGDLALQMVPVNVASEQQKVEAQRVAVLKQELEAKEQHGKVGLDFELAKLTVIKRAEVCIAAAGAMAQLQGTIHANVVGTPENVGQLMSKYMDGMGFSKLLDGFFDGASPSTHEMADGLVGKLQNLLGAAAQRLAPVETTPASTVVSAPAKPAEPASNGAE